MPNYEPATEKQKAAASKVGKKRSNDIKAVKEKTEAIKQVRASRPHYANPVLLAYRIARYMTMRDQAEWQNSNGKQKGLPYTRAGAMAAAGILQQSTWDQYRNGEYDNIIEDSKERIVICYDGTQQEFYIHNIEDRYLPYTLYLLGDLDGYVTDTETIEDYAAGIDKQAKQEWAKEVYFSEILQRYEMLVYAQRESDGYVKGRTFDIFSLKQYGWKDEVITTQRKEVISIEEGDKLLTEYFKSKQLPG